MKPLIAVPITLLLVIRSYRRQSLTPLGILAAGSTATIHALHPSPLPFMLLVTFFLLGTTATKVKHEVKSTLTLSSGGGSGGEGPRTTVQVLANSGCASLLCLFHVLKYGIGQPLPYFGSAASDEILSSLILIGIIGNYVSVTADTLSSELGILSRQHPVLITNPFLQVPKGTNGGVTLGGILYGFLGSTFIAGTSILLLPFPAPFSPPEQSIFSKATSLFSTSTQQPYAPTHKVTLFLLLSLWGCLGSLLDSLLGALLQASVVDRRTGKIVEGTGGVKVLTRTSFSSPNSTSTSQSNPSSPQKRRAEKEKPRTSTSTVSQESRFIGTGRDLLDNNQINFLMASMMSVGAMVVAYGVWVVGADTVFS